MSDLTDKRVAILATNGFEESELSEPMKVLRDNGIQVDVVSESRGTIRAWSSGDWSSHYDVNRTLDECKVDEYDALVLPGGVINPDKLRRNADAVAFVQSFFKQHKPVAAICHGPWMLVEADVLKGRKVTSFYSIRKDVENAGAKWEDKEVVVDKGLVTSRTPADLEAFNKKLIEEIREGKHAGQTA